MRKLSYVLLSKVSVVAEVMPDIINIFLCHLLEKHSDHVELLIVFVATSPLANPYPISLIHTEILVLIIDYDDLLNVST